jgi:hypothetical protein
MAKVIRFSSFMARIKLRSMVKNGIAKTALPLLYSFFLAKTAHALRIHLVGIGHWIGET